MPFVEVGFSGRGLLFWHSVQAGVSPYVEYTLLYPHKVVVYF